MTANDEQKTINGLVITYRDIESLMPYENNPRTHSDAQIDVLVASLREFGWTNPILLDGKNGIIAGEGPGGEAGMQALLDGFFAAHGVDLDAEPTLGALRAMQRLLDGVPERWRDAEVAWWPNSPSAMWAAPESSRS
jgi:hypothetical protein